MNFKINTRQKTPARLSIAAAPAQSIEPDVGVGTGFELPKMALVSVFGATVVSRKSAAL